MLQFNVIDHPIVYDGSQLHSHWIYTTTGLLGDALVIFRGPCHVNATHMVDLVDRRNEAWIHSEEMLHCILEFFDQDLEKSIIRQHLLICIIAETIRTLNPEIALERKGNDLFLNSAKLNVSIATISPVSTLIHIGINISSRNTPVNAVGLDDLNIDVPQFISEVTLRTTYEMERISNARYKVLPVG